MFAWGGYEAMSNSLHGIVLDSIEFARRSARLDGVVEIAGLARVHDHLVEREGQLSVVLCGERDPRGRSWLTLEVHGVVVLMCQRCLNGVRFPLAIRGRLELIPDGKPWPDESLADDDADAIAADPALNVMELVEDEVLLALPLAPTHNDCKLPGGLAGGQGRSPFAALEILKKH